MDRIASFGPSLTNDGITGNLQVARYNGCQAVPAPCGDWIALVERGNCTFIEKVRFVQQSNAKAEIVGDGYSNGWVSMYTSDDSSDITIPSVYISKRQLLSLLNQLHKNNSSIPVKLTCQHFLGALLDIIFTTIIPPMHRKRNKEFSHLPLKTFCEKEERDGCVICLDENQRGDMLRVLPCHHRFHSQYIDIRLLTRKKYCPICKRDAFQPDESTPLL